MATFVRANHEVLDFVSSVMEEYHPHLAQEEVTVDVRWAIADGEGAALKKNGYPAAAIISITPLKQRVLSVADAVIDLDRDVWLKLTEAEQKALIDHELHHLELVVDEDGVRFKHDDHGRPKLKMRPHDWEIGGFTAVAQRHQGNALETKALQQAAETTFQQVFPWG